MKKVDDPCLEEEIREIIYQLFNNVEKYASSITFALYEDIIPLGHLWITPQKHLILINIEAKEMLKSEEGRAIVCATLAHEIGHIYDAKNTHYYFEDTLEFRVKAEVKADQIALILMKRIYDNPKEILLKQINRAFNKMLDIENVDKVKMDLAIAFREERTKALMVDN